METEEVIEEELTVVEGEEVVFEDGSSLPFQYDGVFNLTQERNLLYDLYQPEETANGTFVCKICLRTGKEMEFTERNSFVAHRYKCHGSYNNTVLCPVDNCREVFASLTTLRKHMSHSHNLPLEVHQQAFANIGEFERWRHLLELSTGCRFMMHTKQPKLRRQVMHCSKSEHKLVLQTNKHRLPRLRMSKEGACCPAHISFRIDAKTGEVHSFAQLYHIGHTPSNDEPSTILPSISLSEQFRPTEVHFPPKQRYYGEKPMQYIQIDLYEMCTAIYNASIYETVLLITDLKTGYLWARALTDFSRSVITRILTSIFTEFGIPEGYSTCYSPTYIRDSMKSIEMVFDAEIREVWNEPPPYEEFEQWLITVSNIELGSSNRWVEQLQFLVMEYNQRAPVDCISPFERMFGRKPPRVYPEFEDDEEEEEDRSGNIIGKNKEKYYKKTRPSELEQELEPIPIAYQAGEKVYLRRVLRKPGRGMNSPYIYGYIAEVDLTTPHFPYKVHYSSTDSPWPSEANIYAWMSSNDILPTAHKIRDVNEGERSYSIKRMFCTCSGVESIKYDCTSQNMNWKQYSNCPLYQNIMCSNKMSLFCCKVEGQVNCPYHNYYPINDDSYVKLEMALVSCEKFMKEQQNKQNPNMLQNVSFQYNKSYQAANKKVATPVQSSAGEPPIKVSKTETPKANSPAPASSSDVASTSQPSQQQQETIEEDEPEQSQEERRSKAPSETPSEKRRQSGRKAKPKAFDDYIA